MSVMAVRMRRVLVLAKRSAYDMYVARHQDPSFTRFLSEPQVRKILYSSWFVELILFSYYNLYFLAEFDTHIVLR